MKLLKILPVIIFLCCSVPAFSQTKVLDSLFNRLNNEKTDSTRVHLINLIASEYTDSNPAKVLEYGQKALDLAREQKLVKQQADASYNLGMGNVLISNYTGAVKCFTDSQLLYESLYKKHPSKKRMLGLARAYSGIGVVCNEQNDYAKALEYFFKALKLFEKAKQYGNVAAIYNGIGVVYKSQKEYKKALVYFGKAYTLQQKKVSAEIAVTLTNIGEIHLNLDEDAKALESYKKAESTLQRFLVTDRSLGELYNNYGNYYRKHKDYTTAKSYYEKALVIFNDNEELFGASATLEYLGRIAEQNGQYALAADYYERSSQTAGKIGVTGQVKDSEKALSELYENQGNIKEAFEHYKKYSIAHDSLINSENLKALVREEMNFEFERREAGRKLEIEKKQVLYKEQVKRHRLQMIFGSVFVALAFGVVFLIYSRRQIKKNLTLQRDLAEYEQKALHLQMNPHFVFNCLGAISGFIVQNGTDSAIKYLAKFSKLMRLTLEYSKESLIPIDREIESLQNYLELEQLRFNQIFDFTITKDDGIEDDMALPPLLIQPFVENAIIHGIVPKKDKGLITVDFKLIGECLVCTITDDGIGLAQSKALKENSVTVHKSMALEITRKRLEVIQAYTSKEAKVEIANGTDAQGKTCGTKITLSLPIQYLSDIK